MSKSARIFSAVALVGVGLAAGVLSADAENTKRFGLGREATAAEVKAWDIDVRPDGQGLPEGKGSVSDGERIFTEQCAACHGDFGEGVDRWPPLVGGRGTLKSDNPVKTIGSYWPYASTVFDYIKRAMPFGNAQSLSDNDVYAVTAYLLYMNEIVDKDDFVLSKSNFGSIKMPNVGNFMPDNRMKTPVAKPHEPCMSNCKSDVKITGRARVLDVTPDKGDANK